MWRHSRRPSSSSQLDLRIYIARSLVFSSEPTNSNKPLSLSRISAFEPSVKPPPGVGLISIATKFAPKNGCSNFVDSIEVSGTLNESKDGLIALFGGAFETNISCNRLRYWCPDKQQTNERGSRCQPNCPILESNGENVRVGQ